MSLMWRTCWLKPTSAMHSLGTIGGASMVRACGSMGRVVCRGGSSPGAAKHESARCCCYGRGGGGDEESSCVETVVVMATYVINGIVLMLVVMMLGGIVMYFYTWDSWWLWAFIVPFIVFMAG